MNATGATHEAGALQLIYYVALSLDGFIAPPDGGVEWLAPFQTADEDYGFQAFYETVDALIEGSSTYEQSLGFGAWPHPGKPCWVCTRQKRESSQPEVHFTAATPAALMQQLAAQGHRRVWLVGGSQLAASFRDAGLITDYVLSFIPVLLGSGRPLFGTGGPQAPLRLMETKSFPSGLVQVRYVRANA